MLYKLLYENSMKLWQKSLLATLLGIIYGVYGSYFFIFEIIQTQFMNFIKLVSGPLVFFLILSGIANSKNLDNVGNLIFKAIFFFCCSTLLAISIGIGFGYLFKPGVGIDFFESAAILNSSNVKIEIVIPTNIIEPFLTLNLVQIVMLAIGIGLFIPKNSATVISLINELSQIFMHIIIKIMNYSYILAFAATSVTISKNGLAILFVLSKLVIATVSAIAFQYLVLIILIRYFGKISPMPFIRKSIPYQILAFSTSSTKATLPTAIELSQKKLGVSSSIASLLLPLGSTLNMDGTAIYLGIMSIFFSQLHGIDLSYCDLFNITIMSTFGSIGAAGLPSGSLIVITSILQTANIPISAVGILLSVDRILDMLRTTINMTGDVAVTLIIDSRENTLNKQIYYKNSDLD